MSKKSAIRRHVQTSIVARIIYRLICIILIVAGCFGLFMSFSASEQAYRYPRRDKITTAIVTKKTKEADKYGYDNCLVSYKFTVDGQDYATEGVLPNNYSCNAEVDKEITIRYQADNPANNAYGDNEQAVAMWTIIAVVLAILGIIPLGVGFVGLVAIHKALREEHDWQEQSQRRSEARKRRRNENKDSNTEE